MEQHELLALATAALERLHVPYLVTGSMATIFYGEPRLTNDIDIVAKLRPEQVRPLVQAFPAPDFYVSDAAITDALRQHGQFNVIHPASGLKIDIIIPADSAFERSRFARAVRVQPGPDSTATFASPEDVILRKLEYFRDGGSEKHLRDITGVLKISGDHLDYQYLNDWAARLGVTEIWQTVRQRAGR